MPQNPSPAPLSFSQFLISQQNPNDKPDFCKYPQGLYIVSTPIGNLEDITLRALNTLAFSDLIVCEDTRHTQKLLNHYGLKKKLLSYFDHNEEQARPKILRALDDGLYVSLVSDAGTPLISDPGYKLVQAVLKRGHLVAAVPGPSSLLAGLVVSGLASDRFFFEGFLPAKSSARKTRLETLKTIQGTLIFFESPQRLKESIKDMAGVLGNREACVARELTKKFEECRRGPLPDLALFYEQGIDPTKGEIAVYVAPPLEESHAERTQKIDDLLKTLLKTHTLKEAVSEATDVTGSSKKEVYSRALALREEKP
ncbi:MAG: 16S rRNA (cytidine(1402)-2'-O)-methyltransferase [Alphaproteobacteria bacterium]|nr:16S rRNA (cytidine(1402)-2'-O)-methyltransferase [Alphaproteobacteria bacterium]